MRVYRFEHAEHGRGAVSYGGCDGPVPECDDFPYDWKEQMAAKGSPGGGGWFGVLHLEHGARWFRPDQRRRFAEQGDIVVSVYEVADDHVLIGGCQVIFVREKAQKVDELCPYSFGPARSHHRHVRGEDRDRYRYEPRDRIGRADFDPYRWRGATAEELAQKNEAQETRVSQMMDLYRMTMPPSFKELAERMMEPLRMSNPIAVDWGSTELRMLAIDECPAPPARLDEEPADKPGFVRVNNGSTTCRAELAGLYRRK